MTAPPPAAPAGAPPPPAPNINVETTADAVVKSLLPVIEGWEKINAKETRDMLARLLGEKTAQGPLQGPWAIADELLARARQEWESPTGDPYTPLIAACFVIQKHPVPAATQPPAQDSTTPTWGDFPATLPGAAETTHATTDTDKAARRAAKRARKAIKRARQRALLIGVIAGVAGVAGVIAGATSGWAALAAALIAGVAGVAGIVTGIKVYGVGHSRRRPRR